MAGPPHKTGIKQNNHLQGARQVRALFLLQFRPARNRITVLIHAVHLIQKVLQRNQRSNAPGRGEIAMRKADKTRRTGKKKHGKRIIAVVLILAAAAVAGFFLYRHFHQQEEMPADTQPAPEQVIRTDLENIYSASGSVISADEDNANPQSFGDTTYPIKEVFVKVGDSVKAGDRLYTLDMTDVENDIALAQKKLSIEQQQNAIDQAAAGRAVRSAQETSAQQYEDATRTLTEQAEDTNKAILEQVHSQQDVDRFIRAEADAKAALDAAQKAADAADQKYAGLQSAVSNAQRASNDASQAAASAPDISKLTPPAEPALPQEPVAPTAPAVPVRQDGETQEHYDAVMGEYADAKRKYDQDQAAYENALKAYNEQKDQLMADYNKAKAEYDKQVADYNAAKAKSGESAQKVTDASYALTQAQQNLSDYSAEHDKTSAALSKAQSDYDAAKSAREAAEAALKTAQQGVTSSVRSLEQQGSATKTANRSTYESELSAKDSAAKQALANQAGTLDAQDTLKRAKQKLENGTVYAETDGTVTAVNIVPGQSYSGAGAVVINNLGQMKVTVNVDEGHIADLHVGTPVRIKTDSTGEETLTGKVCFTALTPVSDTETPSDPKAGSGSSTSSQSSQSGAGQNKGKAQYRVDISLDQANERLRLGMTARIDFILASEKNVLAVPTSCITTDPDGSSYVTVLRGASPEAAEAMTGAAEDAGSADSAPGTDDLGQSMQIPVETGISNDYYTQITSGDLKEGDQVLPAASSGGSEDGMLSGIYG